MNIFKRICGLSALILTLALTAGLTAGSTGSGDRVSEICVIGGDIHYCAPKDL